MYQLHHHHLRVFLLPLVAAAAVAVTVTPALGVGWYLDALDQSWLPLDNNYHPPGTGGLGMTVWIVSTGIDPTHVEFGNRAQQVANFAPGPNMDTSGHGTWVASIVGGATFGVAPNVQLRGVRAFDECGASTPDVLIDAIEYVQANADGSSVAVIAFAVDAHPGIDTAVNNLVNSGVPTIVAAGDYGEDACLYSPARAAQVVTVGALDMSFGRSASSNYGSCVDFYAPGVEITAAWSGSDLGTATHDGTAASAAIVAGLVAIEYGEVSALQNYCSRLAIDCGSPPYGGGGDDPLDWYRIYDEPCLADVNCDEAADVSDLLAVLSVWGSCTDCPEDIDGNGAVDVSDLLEVLTQWGPCSN